MNLFLCAFLRMAGAGAQGSSLAARWIYPSVLSDMGTWCLSLVPYASWWFPWEELHNYFLVLNKPFFPLEVV